MAASKKVATHKWASTSQTSSGKSTTDCTIRATNPIATATTRKTYPCQVSTEKTFRTTPATWALPSTWIISSIPRIAFPPQSVNRKGTWAGSCRWSGISTVWFQCLECFRARANHLWSLRRPAWLSTRKMYKWCCQNRLFLRKTLINPTTFSRKKTVRAVKLMIKHHRQTSMKTRSTVIRRLSSKISHNNKAPKTRTACTAQKWICAVLADKKNQPASSAHLAWIPINRIATKKCT